MMEVSEMVLDRHIQAGTKTLFMAVFVTGVGGDTTALISYVLKETIH